MATKTFKIKPKVKGSRVLDPITFEPLNAAGETKPRSEHWLRRIKDESVVEIKPKNTTEDK